MDNKLKFFSTSPVQEHKAEHKILKISLGLTSKGKYCMMVSGKMYGKVSKQYNHETGKFNDPQISWVEDAAGEQFWLMHENNSSITIVEEL
jgi:ribosomal protein S4E